MDIESQLYNILSEFIFGNICFTLELADEFVRRGRQGGWPADCLTFLPREMVLRDLIRMAVDLLGDLPVLGPSGTVASVWRCREEARRGGGRGGGMGGGGSGGMAGGMAGGGAGVGGVVGSIEWV